METQTWYIHFYYVIETVISSAKQLTNNVRLAFLYIKKTFPGSFKWLLTCECANEIDTNTSNHCNQNLMIGTSAGIFLRALTASTKSKLKRRGDNYLSDRENKVTLAPFSNTYGFRVCVTSFSIHALIP